jgi:hypothetical protein
LRHALDGATFVIWLAADHLMGWTREQIEPLLYHQLLRAEIDEKGNPFIAAADFEGFVAELREYGPWQADLKLAVKAVRQLPMALTDEFGDDDIARATGGVLEDESIEEPEDES